jgi:hypothetical protein
MVPLDEIRRLEYAVREAQANLDAARAENASAELKWRQMVTQAEQQMAQGKSVTAEFIICAAERARRDGADAIPPDRLRGDNIVRNFMSVKDKFK